MSAWELLAFSPPGWGGVLLQGLLTSLQVAVGGYLLGMMIGMRTMMTLGSVLSSPTVVGGVVYFGSTDGTVYAVR